MAIVTNLWTDWQTLPCPVCSHKVITVVLIIQSAAVVSYLFAFLASVLDSWLVIWSFVREHLSFVMLSYHSFLKRYSYYPTLVFVNSWCIWRCFPETIDWSYICILKIRHLFMIIFMSKVTDSTPDIHVCIHIVRKINSSPEYDADAMLSVSRWCHSN